MSDPSPELLKLKRWMEEYVLDRRMGDVPSAPEVVTEEIDFSAQTAPDEYQIRLWPSSGEEAQPVYGLILREGYNEWRILPFSPYAFPAVPEERRVREEPPVRVVQGWNARVVPAAEVCNSWCVAELPEEVRFAFARWWLALQAGTLDDLSNDESMGAPLQHPLDPRHDYMDSERMRVDSVLGETSSEYCVPEHSKAAEPEEREPYCGGEEAGDPLE